MLYYINIFKYLLFNSIYNLILFFLIIKSLKDIIQI